MGNIVARIKDNTNNYKLINMLTLEQAAIHYAKMLYPSASESNVNYIRAKENFEAGAAWQKEQYKELINLARQLLGAYDIRYPDAKPLLAGYTNQQAFDKFNQLLDQLQSE